MDHTKVENNVTEQRKEKLTFGTLLKMTKQTYA